MNENEPLTKADIERLLEFSPYIRFMNLSVESFDLQRHEISVKMPMRAEFERGGGSGQFHGGAISGLIDTTGDFAVVLALHAPVPTINLRIDYLRPCVGAFLVCTARARRIGRTVAVVDVDVFDEASRLCAIGRGCYSAIVG